MLAIAIAVIMLVMHGRCLILLIKIGQCPS